MKIKNLKNKDFILLASLLQLKNNFLIIPHKNIDGDVLGCMLALYLGLKKINKEIYLFTNEKIPDIYNFLPAKEKVEQELSLKSFEVAVLLECSSLERIPEKLNLRKIAPCIINIDHHPDNKYYGDYNWIDSSSAALGEMIYQLLIYLKIELDLAIATCLYISILTDCGAFQYSNTTMRTHQIASELLKFPIPINEVSRKIYKEKEFKVLKLLGKCLANLETNLGGKIVWGVITKEMFRETQTSEADTQHFIEEINQIKDAEIVILFKETKNSEIKLSLRSLIFPVNRIAANFGGGGHPQAAGCAIAGNLKEVIPLAINRIIEEFYY
ncbi:MAG: bifunctional oligoribonuclease/PAP phosphatase NrnA [Armatimonadetes bacterium]|nr:bifunctional oligoribonuclease/PAP phosphatase NrnA [Armatimonadota bacterium]